MTAKDTTAAYASWTRPGTQFTLSYSLPLFHEIDFLVNEGYRRIPHGGIETGGLLFGHLDGSTVRLDAFRNIQCEHASGPSFTLSERDVVLLKQQLSTAASDPELEGLQVLGWFIAHTRSDLRMNEREATLFGELFPEPGKITVLVKPEKFQPTRFGFLIRESTGAVNLDATQNAVILPLSGRSDHGAGSAPIPSIPASSGERPRPQTPLFRGDEPSAKAVPLPPAPIVESGAEPGIGGEARASMGEPTYKESTGKGIPNRLSIAMSREPALPEAAAENAQEVSEPTTEALVRTRALPPLDEIRRLRPLELHRRALDPLDPQYQIRPSKEIDRGLNFRLATALLLAAVLGCALGYWTYQRIAPSAIPLTVEPKPSTLVVSWPIEQTRDAGFAALKIDDGNPMPLTPEQKAAGEAEISLSSDNMKVELIVQHRIGDARGIVRYIRSQKPAVSQGP